MGDSENIEVEKCSEITELEKKEDKRGFLVEFLKEGDLDSGSKKFAQIYVTTLASGAIRGNHYHKERLEWIAIFNGRVRVVLENTKTKKREDFILDNSGKFLKRVCIKNGISHAFKNISNSTVVLVAYTDKIYDPKRPDTYDYKIL